ncbi:death-associated inhibitor of apoptosis 1 isoform X1 [Drosophila novamexicana]|uniref:death-associated inhibitor of apoptosis 1 isoform X1 n=1 Tax=Drosophila novamexicana TaxID=47314 RepID=UPI0011E5CD3E|nr:death-associated inhibitor of apoptosis 1 isoform X1 [Drosophila novamexicana]
MGIKSTKHSYSNQHIKMANVASPPRFIPYGSVTTATTTTTATATTLDQVDNSTTATQLLKAFVNRMNDKYNREDERLRTFDNWPLSWLDKHALAQTGMFFTNEDDKVKCFFCEVEIGRWEREDHPVQEHLRWSPNCPLLRRRNTNNVPINADALDRILPPVSYDVCGSNDTAGLDVRENAYSEGRQSIQSTGVNTSPPLRLGGVGSPMGMQEPCSRPAGNGNGGNYFPEYPEYAIESARLRSFEDWPRNMKQKPQQLAEAGFFYTGVGDRVRCFSCGGGLKDWDDNDEPWEQHALWLSQCRFVKLIKGRLYIDAVAAAAQAAKPAAGQAADDEKQQQPASSPSPPASQHSSSPSVDSLSSAPVPDALAAPSASTATVVAAAAAASGGDDVAPTCAARIYDKILAQGCPEGAALASAAGGVTVPEEKLCKICYAAEYNTAFLPCGHVVACAKCASSVTKCPLCRKPFTDVMRVYFS